MWVILMSFFWKKKNFLKIFLQESYSKLNKITLDLEFKRAITSCLNINFYFTMDVLLFFAAFI